MNIIKKLRKAADFWQSSAKLAKFRYTAYYEKLPVSDNVILIEAFNGDGITGNPFWLLKAILEDERLADCAIHVAAGMRHADEIGKLLSSHGMERARVVLKYTKSYCRLLATAKYLITDVSLPVYFIKKPRQVLLNTWHGTPLKGLGRSIKDNPHTIGNVQRLFLMSDYLLYPNRFTFEKMREDYMIGPFYRGKYVLSGYPRNDILFDEPAAARVRQSLGFGDKRLIMVMPTWREPAEGQPQGYHSDMLTKALRALDATADDNTVIIAKLHHLAAESVDFSAYRRVIPFPAEYETYEVLAAADCLITDYSSVLFDFADTGRKIVLYTYDSADYQRTRSMYFPVEELPFPQTADPDALAREALSPDFAPYTAQMAKFTEFDHPRAARDLIDCVFFGRISERMEVIDGSAFHDGKPNALIFGGSLIKNGITTALLGILEQADTSRCHYLVTFYGKLVTPNKEVVNRFGRDICYLPMPEGKPLTYFEAVCQYLYFHRNLDFGFIRKAIERVSARDVKRCFPSLDFHAAIHYTGYEKFVIHLINAMDTRKIIYVHNDIMKEARSKSFVHTPSMLTAYRSFDRIVVVRDSMRGEIMQYIPSTDGEKIVTAHNLNNIGYIRRRAAEELTFDSDTECNLPLARVREMLADNSAAKFVNIARFAREKGLDRLVEAFAALSRERSGVYLFLIGGYGPVYEELRDQVKATGLDNIVLIKSLSNPYPILAASDAFVLSSRYEGLPMTIMEALILGKPVVSTDIPGPSEFLRSNGCGLLVEDSEEGVLDGLRAYFDGRLDALAPFDAEGFNRRALSEYEAVISV